MVAGCLFPILKSILKTEGKILSQLWWMPWSYSYLHPMRAWPCDLNLYFIALAKLPALLVTGYMMRKRFRAKALWSCVPADWEAGEAGPWLVLMITPAFPLPLPFHPSSRQTQHLLPAACFSPLSLNRCRSDSTTCSMQRLDTWTRTFWCRWDLARKLLWEEPCICLTYFFMVTCLCLVTDFFKNFFKGAVNQNTFPCMTVTSQDSSSFMQSTSVPFANNCTWCLVCRERG